MTDREKVIKGLGSCVEYFASRVKGVMFDEWLEESRKAIALLKAQEPRIMTDGEWLEWKNTPPSLREPIYYENHDGTYRWLHPNDILQVYTANWGYGIVFRCWTTKPTKKQSEAAKWND